MKLIKIDVLYSIKKNIGYFYNLFGNGNIEDKLIKEFSSSYYDEGIIPPVQFDFDMSIIESGKARRKTDLNNSIEIYSKLMNLSESQASDERFWVEFGSL